MRAHENELRDVLVVACLGGVLAEEAVALDEVRDTLCDRPRVSRRPFRAAQNTTAHLGGVKARDLQDVAALPVDMAAG